MVSVHADYMVTDWLWRLAYNDNDYTAWVAGCFYMVCVYDVGLAPAAFTPGPYVLGGQDPYAVGIPIAAAG